MTDTYIDTDGNAYRRVYIVFHDGVEIGALLSRDAVDALTAGIEQGGGEPEEVYSCEYYQPMERSSWLSDSLGAIGAHKLERERGPLKKAVYTMHGWQAVEG